MSDPSLAEIEQLAAAQGLLLRLQVRRWLAITSLRVVVARPRPDQPPLLVGELKGWALPLPDALQLDTMRVQGPQTQGVGALIWAATFAWALESTPAAAPACWPSATTISSTAAWCAISSGWGLSRFVRWERRRLICPCVWCGAGLGY